MKVYFQLDKSVSHWRIIDINSELRAIDKVEKNLLDLYVHEDPHKAFFKADHLLMRNKHHDEFIETKSS